jgi:hypothetical protein
VEVALAVDFCAAFLGADFFGAALRAFFFVTAFLVDFLVVALVVVAGFAGAASAGASLTPLLLSRMESSNLFLVASLLLI